ncbi:MAG: ABC transporter substrate-binding protein [Deltaproteobacteria bacterium]|nr:MAG: ABC transporter substrate-binding protein [Deltaproteobacteria bacterium]
MKTRKMGKKGLTRREFIKTVGVAGVAAAGVSFLPLNARGAAKDHILIGHPTPATGPIAPFGEASGWADKRAMAEINKDGGIYLKELGKKLPIKVKAADTESNPTKAAEVASKLILHDKVDLMVVAHTPDTVNPVGAICERYKVPCISSVAPIEPWLTGGPYKWTFHFFWNLGQIIDVYTGMWDEYADKTNKVVGGFWPNDPDGTVWAEEFGKALAKKGYKVVDVGRFPYGMQDFSGFVSTWKKEKVDILTGVPIPPDWATCWRQCHQQGFIPKFASIGKAILFPAAVEAIGGDLPSGLTSEVWWTPLHPFKSSLAGSSCMDLANSWTEETGRQWTQPQGFDYALFEIAADALKRAGSPDKEKIREALVQTDLDTLVGHIKFNEKNFSLTPLVGGQWVKGKKWPWELELVYNREAPSIPTTAKMVFPLPR